MEWGAMMYTISRTLIFLVQCLFAASVFAADEIPTGRLPRTAMPSLVELELRVDPREERFGGITRIHLQIGAPTDTIWMHGRDLQIERAELTLQDGRRLGVQAEQVDVSGVLRMRLAQRAPAGKATLEIAYSAPFGELQGAYRVNAEGNDYVITQMAPLGARNTFPCFDEPSFKHPWDIALIVPEQDVALANSREIKSEKIEDGWKKVTFARTEALPTYLIAFVVGPWDVPQGPHIAPSDVRKRPIALRGVAAKGQGGRMQYALANTPAIVHALEDYFGSPYPFDKLDSVAAPDFGAGAMENAGLIVYRDTLMFANEGSPVNVRQAYWRISAHEIAHQWFGNSVTMRWWDDVWLNEAFATWIADKITDRLKPEFHVYRTQLERAIEAMEADSLASTRRIREPIENFTQIFSAFDVITYLKGGAVLSMFESYVGETAFRDGVRTYLREHARGNATSDDLINAVAAQMKDGAELKAAFRSYIEQPGVPFVEVDVDCGNARPALLLQQRRYLPLGSRANAEQTWSIPLTVRYADGGHIREEKGIVSGATGRFELRAAQGCPTWVMPNAHGVGYYRFALAPRWHEALSAAFDILDEREQRAYADAITSAYGAGVLTPNQMLAALPKFAGGRAQQTVTAGHEEIRWMREHLVEESQRGEFSSAAADIYRPRLRQLGFVARTGESDEDRQLRVSLMTFLAQDLEDREVRAELNRAGRAALGLGGDGKLHLDAVHSDLLRLALSIAVKEGGAEAFEAAAKHLSTAQDPVVRNALVSALGSAVEPSLAARARATAFETLHRGEILTLVGSQANNPPLRAGLREWIAAHFEELDRKLAPMSAYLISLYATGLCDEKGVARLQADFGQRVKTVEGGPIELAHASERVHLCAAAKKHRQGESPRFTKNSG